MTSILRAIRGNWLVVVICTAASLIGGLVVMTTSQPRYQGTARVILDYIRPDPTTGQIVPSKMIDAYVGSQIRMVRDYQVAAPAAEALGWMDSPDFQIAYAQRPPTDTRDFAAWISAPIIARTSVRMVDGSNIMEISYQADSPEAAVAVAEALRQAYISAGVRARQTSAGTAAENLTRQIERVRTELASLESDLARAEDQTGIMIGDNGRDEEAAKLRNLARRGADIVAPQDQAATPSEIMLRQLELEMAQEAVGLGPNNPRLLELSRRREVLRAQVAAERAALASAKPVQDSLQRSSELLERQKERVLSLREPLTRLRLQQDEVNHKREELRQLTESLANMRALAGSTTTTTTAVGVATPSPRPVFPNPWLILIGSTVLGLAVGGMAACLAELMGRRVRVERHLEQATNRPVIAVIPDMRRSGPKRAARLRQHAVSPKALEFSVG